MSLEQDNIDYYRDRFTNHLDSFQEPFRKWMKRRPLRRDLVHLLGSKDAVRVLDIGCGPITTLGCYSPDIDMQLEAVDIRADAYNDLLDEFGFQIPVRPIQGAAEDLVRLFGSESFDLVHCRNSLDHTANAMASLRAMVDVTKPGGFVYIEVYEREGRANKYGGIHQWDIYISDDGILTLGGKSMAPHVPLLACVKEKVRLYHIMNYLSVPTLDADCRKRAVRGKRNYYFDSEDGQDVVTARTIRFVIRKNG